MEKTIICECGHHNPPGTLICQSCGKPFADAKENMEASMRYEGTARRSQTYNRTAVDKIWNFFSSVKVGIWIIVVILVAAAIGTIFPQEMYIPQNVDPASHYESEYGNLGKIYFLLGFHNLYGSWWFIVLLGMLALSIIVASIDRGVPLYKSLKRQKVIRHDQFLKHQRLFAQDVKGDLGTMKIALKEQNYKIREENGSLFAEKGRFSRWGPYVNHVGLVIFLAGAMLRFFPGMYVEEVLWLREGDTAAIPGTLSEDGQYYLKNEKFILEFYDKNDEQFKDALQNTSNPVPKNFQTNAVLYKSDSNGTIGAGEIKKVKEGKIQVNKPLKFDSFSLYQTDFKMDELNAMSFSLVEKESQKKVGAFEVDLINPKKKYDLGNGYSVNLGKYYPNYFLEDGEPKTKNNVPDNPAFVFEMISPESTKKEKAFVAIKNNIEMEGNRYKVEFAGIKTKNLTALTVRKDHTLPIVSLGGIIFMIGVVQGLYWNHRRIWIKEKEGGLWIAAHTNKNWFGIKKDLQKLSDKTGIVMPEDRTAAKTA
ncbi:cytochrome c biogenesis protein ResB [Fictibacillus aquaticus]|uniref:Cytochrome C biogenesis protein n=1 Tax=Fictibacillus aquaticus TaxID=2021314 RepID=A0A235FAR3_9BACL|nr:cytochrome c biogenesis protein ResB [Fictibacillus aquaticus]OYD58416.1 cytochrome C biogenesis protein [Fictibacillus aquaticus]